MPSASSADTDAGDSALPPVSGVTVDEAQFLGTDQLQQWQLDLDNRGLGSSSTYPS